MTHSPSRLARPVADLEEACDVLREGGGRVSAARRSILAALFASEDPLTVDALAARADPPLDIPATYRNLDHLAEVGLVRHVHLGHGPGRYELIGRVEGEYAFCEDCEAVLPIGRESLRILRGQILATVGIRPSFAHFPLVGQCRSCCDQAHSDVTSR